MIFNIFVRFYIYHKSSFSSLASSTRASLCLTRISLSGALTGAHHFVVRQSLTTFKNTSLYPQTPSQNM